MTAKTRSACLALAAALAGSLVVGGCGDLQPIEYTRASTSTTADLFDDVDDTPVGPEQPVDDIRRARYVVQPGDSLSGIATRFGVTVEALMSYNEIIDANQLEAGVEIRIPGPDATIPPPWLQRGDDG